MESINIPSKVTTIWGGTFAACKSLAGIIIHDGITSIGTNAFARCESLRTIHIPASVSVIGNAILPECMKLEEITVHPDNPAYSSLDGVLCDKAKSTILQYSGGKAGIYTIPETVSTIASHAFSGCAGLTGVSIHQNVTSIEANRFYSCGSLLTITFIRTTHPTAVSTACCLIGTKPLFCNTRMEDQAAMRFLPV